MDDVRATVAELLDDRPELEDDLRELVDLDARREEWRFEDVPLDSGQFGEVVSRGIAVETDDGDGYVLADREAIEAALAGEPAADPGGSGSADGRSAPRSPVTPAAVVERIDRRAVGQLAGALAVLVAVRLIPLPTVFRDGNVVLASNDPYLYRYWVDQLLARAAGPLDLGVLADLPADVSAGEPLLVAVLWWPSELLGGGGTVSGWILAWYPVVAALVSGVLLYLLVVELTDDRRIALASVALLAGIPMHASRTVLGFPDHHAFDYVWLVGTALAVQHLVALDRDPSDARTWLAAAGLGLGVAGQVLAWEAGPLLIMAVGAVVVLWIPSVLRDGVSPVVAGTPIAAGAALGAGIPAVAHVVLGWHDTTVAAAPLVLFAGICATIAVGYVVDRLALPPATVVGVAVVGGGGGPIAVMTAFPSVWDRIARRASRLVGRGGIAETESAFDVVLGVVPGPVWWLGLAAFVAIPAGIRAALWVYRDRRHEWIVPLVYLGYFGVLAAVQRRFVGELAPFVAVFAGLGFVWITAWVDASREPMPADGDGSTARPLGDGGSPPRDGAPTGAEWPDRETAFAVVAIFLLVSSLSILATPWLIGGLTIDDDEYGAAMAARSYSESHGLEYSDNYVLSRWWRNRMYNYFVNGQSQSYWLARHAYEPFLVGADDLPGRAGFVVVDDLEGFSNSSRYRALRNYGSRGEDYASLANYRAIWQHESGSIILYRVVPGATLNGTGPANTRLTVSTEVDIEGASFTYERRVETGPNGSYSVRVPYPGEYRIGEATVTVPESAVENGTRVPVSGRMVGDGVATDRSWRTPPTRDRSGAP